MTISMEIFANVITKGMRILFFSGWKFNKNKRNFWGAMKCWEMEILFWNVESIRMSDILWNCCLWWWIFLKLLFLYMDVSCRRTYLTFWWGENLKYTKANILTLTFPTRLCKLQTLIQHQKQLKKVRFNLNKNLLNPILILARSLNSHHDSSISQFYTTLNSMFLL